MRVPGQAAALCTDRSNARKIPIWALTRMCAWPIVCNMHQPKRTLISVQDAAKLLGESRWTTQRRIRNGELAAEMIGGAFILDAAAVLKLAATIAS